MSELKVGVLGLGAMGRPMACNLASAGLLEAVWNRTSEKALSFASEYGSIAAASPAALAERCNVILTCVSADDDLREVVGQVQTALNHGDIIVDTSTVNPGTAKSLSMQLAEFGVGFVDAPVSGGVEGAVRGTLSVMAGGDSADLERISPVLGAISATVTHMGPVGSGQATKAVNQVIVAGVAECVCEALALSEKLNLPSVRLLSVLGAGAAGGWFLEHRGASMLEDRFDTGFKPALLLKDLKIVRELAQDLDIELNTVDAAIRDYEGLLAGGNEDNDISGLIRLKRGSETGK